jgi:4-diphosphocytidyl-2-C-methyl-D-erythritol kinase
VLINWCDEISLDLRSDGVVSREVLSNEAGVAFDGDDLCTRAAKALQTFCSREQLGVHIAIHKRIPAQAGMGGGSSDAATVLHGLNQLWKLELSAGKLAEVGLKLGADVPFFIRNQHAWVEGIGERISPLPPHSAPSGTQVLVVKPAQGLSTADIFRAPELIRNTPTCSPRQFENEGLGFGRNDMQAVAERICPQVTEAINWANAALGRTSAHPLSARMTGSGSAVFAFVGDATPQLNDLPRGWQSRVCALL